MKEMRRRAPDGLNEIVKKDLIRRIHHRHGDLTLEDTQVVVDHITSTLMESLGSGQRIEIRGFGVFYLKLRLPRMVRNPKTGQTLLASAKHHLLFKTGKELKRIG